MENENKNLENGNQEEKKQEVRTYTQEEVDALLQQETDRRISSAQKKWEKKSQEKVREAEKLAKKLNFTELQADSILELRLARLVGLELTAIEEDLAKVNKNIRRYEKLLKSKAELKKEIKSEVEALKEKYASPRKTQLIPNSTSCLANGVSMDEILVHSEHTGGLPPALKSAQQVRHKCSQRTRE